MNETKFNDFIRNRRVFLINTLRDVTEDWRIHRVEWNSSCTREGGVVMVVGREAVGLVEVYYQRYAGSDPAVAIICL